MPTVALALPQLRQDQWRIARHPAKIKVLSMGRRWGKSVLGGVLAVATASQGGKVAWVVPQYKNGRALWRWVEIATAGLRQAGAARINRTERTIEFGTGGIFGIHSADNPDSMRGEWFHLVVMDEAARISEETWQDVVQPTLADANGDAILISTPKGKNWFFKEWTAGITAMDDKQAAWKAPTSDNPNPFIKAAALKARYKVPFSTYKQEWLAEFLDDGGSVFRRVRDCVGKVGDTEDCQYKTWPVDPAEYINPKTGLMEGTFIGGLDWGRENDFTDLTVFDAATRRVVDRDRFNKIDWRFQRKKVKAMHHKWNMVGWVAEYNSIGGPNVSELVNDNIAIMPFTTTNVSKAMIVERGVMAIENKQVILPPDDVLIGELEAFEQERLPSGAMRYNAPSGLHDDGVMSFLLGLYGASQSVGISEI